MQHAVEIYWLVPGRVIYVEWRGDISLELSKAVFARLLDALTRDGTPPYTHIIHNANAVTDFPKNLGAINLATRDVLRSPKTGWNLYSFDNRLLLFFISMVVQASRARSRFFATPQEAVDFLPQVDETLPPVTFDLAQAEPFAQFAP